MSIILRKALAANAAQARVMANQYASVQEYRAAAEEGHGNLSTLIKIVANNDPTFRDSDLAKAVLSANACRTPAEAYREFDSTTKIELAPAGEFATLTRLLQNTKSINIGKEVLEYRKASTAGIGNTSISGNTAIAIDKADYKYGGAVVPIHDVGFGRNWREVLSMQADGFDALVDDAREAERTLMGTIDSYLWDGDAKISVKGNSWLGLKNDPTVVQHTLGLDLSSESATAVDIRDEVRSVRDVLYITNNVTKGLKLVVSREIMSNWERVYSTSEGTFGTILDMVKRLRGIDEVIEDSRLTGNQVALLDMSLDGIHPVVGMGISTYALPRLMHNSDFSFVKWAGIGFLAKTDYSDRRAALFAE